MTSFEHFAIDLCPICAGTLQATRETDLADVVVSTGGEVLQARLADTGEQTRVCCENGHDLAEMLDALGVPGVFATAE